MAKDKLTLCTLSGSLDKFDLAVQTFVINRQFHPINTISYMKGMEALIPFDNDNPYDEILKSVDILANELKIKLDYKPFDAETVGIDTARSYFNGLSDEIRDLAEEEQQLSLTIADNHNIIDTLRHMGDIMEGVENIFSMKSAKFRFGRIPRQTYADSIRWINTREDTYYISTSVEEDYVYGMYFALPSAEERVDAFFAALHFERIWISEKVQGTPEQASRRLSIENEKLTERISEIKQQISAISENECSKFLQYYSYIRFAGESHSLRVYAGHSISSFYIVGWIPRSGSEEYAEAVEAFDDFSCILTDAADLPDAMPPIKRKAGLLTKLYNPFLEMYGLPSYREFDPGLFMAVTYSLFFGIMFGDVGQGVLLFLFGLGLYKIRGMWLGGILTCCGISATIFGFVYGSVFGYEELLGGFKVMEDGNAMNILLVSAVIGIVMITICMVFNIYNGILQKDIGKIFFEANGLCGMIFYLATVLGLVCTVAFGQHMFSAPYIILLMVLPLLLVMCKGPLTKLILRQPDWRPKSISGLIIEGFFELFETVLSYVSNTISFLRIGAFAISHAGMMMVVFLLAEGAAGSYNPVVLVIGNLFVMALEAMLVCIQLLRLEFYELFGRFYSDGGQKFTPIIIDYTKIYSE